MEERQGTTDQTKRINNSVRSAAIALCLKPETVVEFIPHMQAFQNSNQESLMWKVKQFEDLVEFLYERIEKLSEAVQKHHEEAVRLQQEVKRLTKEEVA